MLIPGRPNLCMEWSGCNSWNQHIDELNVIGGFTETMIFHMAASGFFTSIVIRDRQNGEFILDLQGAALVNYVTERYSAALRMVLDEAPPGDPLR